jgi:hypothetical protein
MRPHVSRFNTRDIAEEWLAVADSRALSLSPCNAAVAVFARVSYTQLGEAEGAIQSPRVFESSTMFPVLFPIEAVPLGKPNASGPVLLYPSSMTCLRPSSRPVISSVVTTPS